jgi:hypothetical protein
MKENSGNEYVGKKHKIEKADDIRHFILAGHAIFTIESTRTGAWYTYKVNVSKKDNNLYFVNVLTGDDQYIYMGMIKNGVLSLTKASKFTNESTCFKAFNFYFRNIIANIIHPEINFYHLGICGRCGRPLTTPDSINRGIGPVCSML